jgi:hypothetical protein
MIRTKRHVKVYLNAFISNDRTKRLIRLVRCSRTDEAINSPPTSALVEAPQAQLIAGSYPPCAEEGALGRR